MKKTLTLVTALCLLFNSCYFNSAGHLFSKAGYTASANSSDARVGNYVYMFGGEYFVELPRYRKGKEILTQYSAFAKDTRTEGAQPTGDVSMFRIPADFAMYLTGQASYPSTPSYMQLAENADAVKSGARLTITRQGADSSHEFKYSSPNAAWWYTAGVFEWLCVDLPVTITENALALTGLAVAGTVAVIVEHYKSTSGVASTSSSSATSRPPSPPSELLEVKDYGVGFVYDVKAEALAMGDQIADALDGRKPSYFTAAEAAYLREFVRANRICAESFAALGNKCRDMNDSESSTKFYEEAQDSQRLADTIEKTLRVIPIR